MFARRWLAGALFALLALLALVALIATVGLAVPLAGHAPRPQLLRVATLNTKMLDKEPSRKQRGPLIIRELLATNADVIALQEVGKTFYRSLRKRTGYAHVTKNQCGLVVLSAFPIIRARASYLPGGYHCHELQRVWIRRSGRTLVFANVHLKSALKATRIRMQQLRKTFWVLRQTQQPDRFLIGDLNFGDGGPENALLRRTYRDPWRILRRGQKGYTWDRERSWLARKSSFVGERSRRLDRILVHSARLRSRSVRLFANRAYGRWFASDHFGVLAVFEISPGRGGRSN